MTAPKLSTPEFQGLAPTSTQKFLNEQIWASTFANLQLQAPGANHHPTHLSIITVSRNSVHLTNSWIHLGTLLKVTSWPSTSHLPPELYPQGHRKQVYSNALFQNSQHFHPPQALIFWGQNNPSSFNHCLIERCKHPSELPPLCSWFPASLPHSLAAASGFPHPRTLLSPHPNSTPTFSSTWGKT